MKRFEGLELRLQDLENIVSDFGRAVINYSDCMMSIDGTLVEAELSRDLDEEAEKYYVDRVNEITKNMPGVKDLEDFLLRCAEKKLQGNPLS